MSITFEAALIKINNRLIIKLPIHISKELPSRGMVMANITIYNSVFQAPLEPDGKGSHWFELQDTLSDSKLEIGKEFPISLEVSNEWMEPVIPNDMMNAIISNNLLPQWDNITVKAKWDWLRWIRSTNNPATRNKRIVVACSKLSKGDKRPCCFDHSRCTVQEVSKSGVLMD